MGFKLELTLNGVMALREWADAVDLVLAKLEDDTNELLKALNSQDNLGIHMDAFRDMFICIVNANNILYDAAENHALILNTFADKIEDYIYHTTGFDSQDSEDSGWQRVRKR